MKTVFINNIKKNRPFWFTNIINHCSFDIILIFLISSYPSHKCPLNPVHLTLTLSLSLSICPFCDYSGLLDWSNCYGKERRFVFYFGPLSNRSKPYHMCAYSLLCSFSSTRLLGCKCLAISSSTRILKLIIKIIFEIFFPPRNCSFGRRPARLGSSLCSIVLTLNAIR